jgi:hypothetical protein
MSGANSMEARIVTFAAAACLISAVLGVPGIGTAWAARPRCPWVTDSYGRLPIGQW